VSLSRARPTEEPRESLVTIEGVTVRYGERIVLEDVNFAVDEGEFICVIGRSGCGKTTLLRMVAGLTRTSAGIVKIAGKPVQSPGQDSAMVFQADSLFPWQNVIGNAGFGLTSRGVGRSEARARALEWLRRVGLYDSRDLKPRQLSGGMRQRVNLVRALVTQPLVLLMDEPFASVDYQTREELQAELVRLCSELGTTVLFVTHDVNEATYLGDRIIVLDSTVRNIKRVIDVPWGRDRPPELKHTPKFAETTGIVWRAMRED
jgi:ABC-type nitrate/sulfonate/bicarbonate transport system ATPase subunit